MAQNIFEKINEWVETSNRCVELEHEISGQLDKWFNEHKSELEEYFYPHLVSFCRHRNSWWYDAKNEIIIMFLDIDLCEDSHGLVKTPTLIKLKCIQTDTGKNIKRNYF